MAGPRPVVALLTDFGIRDHYAAALRSVVVEALPDAQIVDISHDIAPGDVIEGGYVLAAAWRDLPPRAVVVAVVDPGVGSERRGIGIHAHGRLGNGWVVIVGEDIDE